MLKIILKVILKITAIGLYYPYINDEVITKNLFMPGYTDYNKRVQYQEYDITSFVYNNSLNKIDVLLAKGWASSDLFGWSKHPYSKYPLLKAHIIIQYKNNVIEDVISDDSWDIYTSNIIYSDIYNGEIQDLNILKKLMF